MSACLVERVDRHQVDHLGVDAVLRREGIGRGERLQHLLGMRHDRHVAPGAFHVRPAERDQLLGLGHLALGVVEHLVLDEEHGVRLADGGLEQPARVARGGGHDHDQARHVAEPRLEALGMLGRVALARAALRADHQRHLDLAAEHVAHLGDLVDDLVHADAGEVDEHDLGHGHEAGERGAEGGADDRGLGDRGVDQALPAELVEEALRDGHGAAELPDVLADHEHPFVPAELLAQREADRLAVAHLHARAAAAAARSTVGLGAKMSSSAPAGSGSGLFSANSSACASSSSTAFSAASTSAAATP